MFSEKSPSGTPLTQDEVNDLSDGDEVIVAWRNSKPAEWTVSVDQGVRFVEKFGHRLPLEPVGDGPMDTQVWKLYDDGLDDIELDADEIIAMVEEKDS